MPSVCGLRAWGTLSTSPTSQGEATTTITAPSAPRQNVRSISVQNDSRASSSLPAARAAASVRVTAGPIPRSNSVK
jgi:hypothetical protein